MLAKGTNMSEEKPRFMVELDLWSEANVIGPLMHSDPTHSEWLQTSTRDL